jgi:hypothetical protein
MTAPRPRKNSQQRGKRLHSREQGPVHCAVVIARSTQQWSICLSSIHTSFAAGGALPRVVWNVPSAVLLATMKALRCGNV